MARDTRSHDGCWTCRLRRRKCDETHPACSQCISSNLTCHGFGQKPEWMDGGAKERTELTAIKLTVARTVKQRRALQVNRRARGSSSYAIPPSPIRAVDEMQNANADASFDNITLYSHLAPEIVTPLSSTQEKGNRDGRPESTESKPESLRNM
jgi:hypothetical protein